MELKGMTKKEFENVFDQDVGYHYGKKQAIIKEFLDGPYDIVEVTGLYQTAKSFQAGIINAAKSLHAPVRCVQKKGRIFLLRLPE